MLVAPFMSAQSSTRAPQPFCQCWRKRTPVSRQPLNPCSCGEVSGADCEWTWDTPTVSGNSWLVLSDDKRQVTFHPFYSSGTAAVKGDSPFLHNMHYYWEVKILTETYGTDIMVGVGSSKVDIAGSRFEFTSLLGSSGESYGLSYTGALRHRQCYVHDSPGFCRGSIVGVRVDMWQGTLEYYINRKPQGIAFYNLRRHKALYPMVSSTTAQSSMRLVYASSWRSSLLVDALKILASSAKTAGNLHLPPGLKFTSTTQFWLLLPTDGIDTDEERRVAPKKIIRISPSASSIVKRRYLRTVPSRNVDPQSHR